jgi:hypothetical protein
MDVTDKKIDSRSFGANRQIAGFLSAIIGVIRG